MCVQCAHTKDQGLIEELRRCPAYLHFIDLNGTWQLRFSPGGRLRPVTYTDGPAAEDSMGKVKRYFECQEGCHCPRKIQKL